MKLMNDNSAASEHCRPRTCAALTKKTGCFNRVSVSKDQEHYTSVADFPCQYLYKVG